MTKWALLVQPGRGSGVISFQRHCPISSVFLLSERGNARTTRRSRGYELRLRYRTRARMWKSAFSGRRRGQRRAPALTAARARPPIEPLPRGRQRLELYSTWRETRSENTKMTHIFRLAFPRFSHLSQRRSRRVVVYQKNIAESNRSLVTQIKS